MIFHLFRRTPRDPSIASLYGAIVAQARVRAFYQCYGVPDSVNGRFELIVLHAVLLVSRLAREGAPGRLIGQAVFDHFCDDMDANLREMGVGDLAVPRQMRGIGEAFYGRQRVYEEVMAEPDLARLAVALGRNVYGSCGQAVPAGAERLAAYVCAAVGRLVAQDGAALCQGELRFPNPAQILVENGKVSYCRSNEDGKTKAHG
jgi:cytochrome b pre-mRNA-processing protein 3